MKWFQRTNTPPKWEYCELIYLGDSEEEYRLNFYGVVGGQHHAIRATVRGQTIAQLGIEGWELVTSSMHGDHETLYFKRRLPLRVG